MQLHKLGDESTVKGTYIRETNIYTNTHELHEIRIHTPPTITLIGPIRRVESTVFIKFNMSDLF
jgi:hypothetical protein